MVVQHAHDPAHVSGSGQIVRERASQTRSGRDWVIAFLLIAVLLLAYYPALHGGFLWDDDTYISANPTLRTLAGLRAIWLDPSATCQYYPLSFTFFWTVNHFFGLNPFWFHLLTLLLHGSAAVLFWQVLARLRVRGALLAGAIFALHPVNVMSVAWMTELKNTLSASMALGAGWAFVRFAGLGVYERGPKGIGRALPKETRGTPWRWYALSLALFQLAMLAKTAVSFLPATLFLILWWQRERVTRRDFLSLIPMLGISVGMGAFTIYIERHAGGASGQDFTIGLLDRVLISGRSFWFYLGKLVWPSRLTFIYPRWKVDAGEWWQWLYPAATLAVLSGSWMARRRIGRGLFVALMHFYISTSMLILAVVLFMMRYSFVADHWQYFGSLSIIALVASGITQAMDWVGEPWGRPLEMALGIGLVSGLGALTWAQSGMYADLQMLWKTTIARNPGSWIAHNNLGLLLYGQGRLEEAIAQYREALRIDPDLAGPCCNLGNAFLQEGRPEEAIAQYREALRIDPAFVEAHNNLGLALFRQGRTEGAIAQYRACLQLQPAYVDALNGLGLAFFQQGRTGEAIVEYREALRIDAADANVHGNLGDALLQQGRPEGAIAQYREALRLNPALAGIWCNLGIALFQEGQAGEAIPYAQKALELQPADARIQNGLAWMLATAPQASLRNGARAVQLAIQASQATAGNNPEVLRTLAAAYAETGQFPIAFQTAQKALQLAQGQSSGAALAGMLLREIKLYEAGHPFEEAR
jgi:protein O-mannosyl-transferase